MENDDIIERRVEEGKGVSRSPGSFCPISEEEPTKEKQKRHREPRVKPPISRLSKEAVEKLIRLAVASVGNYSTFVEWKTNDSIIISLFGLGETVAIKIGEYPFDFGEQYCQLSADDFQESIIRLLGYIGWFKRDDNLGYTKQQIDFASIARLSIVDKSYYVIRTEWKTDDNDVHLRVDYFYHNTKIPKKIDSVRYELCDIAPITQKKAPMNIFGNINMITRLDERVIKIKEQEAYTRSAKKPIDKEFVESVVREFVESLVGYTVRTMLKRDTVWEWVNDPTPCTGGFKKQFYDVDVIDVLIYDTKSLSFRPAFQTSIPLTRRILGSSRPSIKDEIISTIRDGMKE